MNSWVGDLNIEFPVVDDRRNYFEVVHHNNNQLRLDEEELGPWDASRNRDIMVLTSHAPQKKAKFPAPQRRRPEFQRRLCPSAFRRPLDTTALNDRMMTPRRVIDAQRSSNNTSVATTALVSSGGSMKDAIRLVMARSRRAKSKEPAPVNTANSEYVQMQPLISSGNNMIYIQKTKKQSHARKMSVYDALVESAKVGVPELQYIQRKVHQHLNEVNYTLGFPGLPTRRSTEAKVDTFAETSRHAKGFMKSMAPERPKLYRTLDRM
jgi:hypothetical protein